MDFTQLLLMLVPLVFAITIHEAAHGYMANYLGDNTAKSQGRLSLSPIVHIDPVGTIALPLAMFAISSLTGSGLFIFGWAKPVPFNPRNFKNIRRDITLTAAAGPISNLIQAFLWAIILHVCEKMGVTGSQHTILDGVAIMAFYGIIINIFLMVLNLMPIPPLDGGKIATMLLPYNLANQLQKIEPYGIWIIFGLLWLGVLPIGIISFYILNVIISIVGIFF